MGLSESGHLRQVVFIAGLTVLSLHKRYALKIVRENKCLVNFILTYLQKSIIVNNLMYEHLYITANTSMDYVMLIPELTNNVKIRKAHTNDEDSVNMHNFHLTPLNNTTSIKSFTANYN